MVHHATAKGATMPDSLPPLLLTIQDVQRLTTLSRPSIYRFIAAGTFPKCMKTREGSAIDLLATEYKYYALGDWFRGRRQLAADQAWVYHGQIAGALRPANGMREFPHASPE